MANSPTVTGSHNHDHCIENAISRAQAVCEAKGVRLTPVRRRVLELIWQNHKPTGAYELLPQLADAGFNSAPPTVYRALDFLLEMGLVHRISSLNAFIGCDHPGGQHPTGFFICSECGNATELPVDHLNRFSAEFEQALGVRVESGSYELSGCCRQCQPTS